jgi:glutathione S-transferase
MVLQEKGVDFEVHEVDLSNKSEEFLAVSPTGKVPVVVVDGDSLYESKRRQPVPRRGDRRTEADAGGP